MTQEALKLALEALENSVDLVVEDAYNAEQLYGNMPTRQGKVNGLKVLADEHQKAITAIKEALAQPEHKCNSHPKAPHGFNRNASHANDRYTCECESWDAYEAGYQAGVTAGIEMSTETEQKPVAWLGFNERGECREVFTPKMKETFPNYPTADMIPVYTTPPQPEQEPVAWPHKYGCRANAFGKCDMGCTTPPQRKPLTSKEIRAIEVEVAMSNSFAHPTKAEEFVRAIEAAHGIRD